MRGYATENDSYLSFERLSDLLNYLESNLIINNCTVKVNELTYKVYSEKYLYSDKEYKYMYICKIYRNEKVILKFSGTTEEIIFNINNYTQCNQS